MTGDGDTRNRPVSVTDDCLVNGQWAAHVPVGDRGLLYGDGLFETIAFHGGVSHLWPLHMRRLADGCRRLSIERPDVKLLADECAQLVDGPGRAIVRITITRGSGGRAYFPPARAAPNRILMRRRWPDGLDRQRACGLAMITSSIHLYPREPQGLKHLNRLEQVLMARECEQQSADEALALDHSGAIVEALTGNIVIVRSGRLIAPGPHPAAVAGVGLQWLRERAGQALQERPFRQHELQTADSLWVINSVAGLRPVATLDGRVLPLSEVLSEWQQAWLHDNEIVG
ncbi:MAG: aminodeoxychorismate lyase [Xanthomonadaceae bacterium]|nr:aminodeoxychorismate lyase [Xanthomonadaceae bacterium]